MRIENASKIPKEEIDRMQRDAESHADEDKRKRQLAELRNQAESMVFQLEKLIKEHKDKLKDADKAALESAMKKVREAAKGEDADALKSAIEQLEQASHAFSKTNCASIRTKFWSWKSRTTPSFARSLPASRS